MSRRHTNEENVVFIKQTFKIKLAEDMVPEIEQKLTREENRLNKRYQNVKRKRNGSKPNDEQEQESKQVANNEEDVVKMLTAPLTATLEAEQAVQRLAEGTTTTKATFDEEPAAKIAKNSPVMERPTAGSLGINQSLDEMIATGVGENGSGQLARGGGGGDGDVESDGDLDLEGISDSEIDTMILKPAEVERYVNF